MAAIGERLKTWRKSQRYSGAKLGELAECAQNTVSSWESGRTQPPLEKLAAFYRLGLNLNWLIVGEGPMLLADLSPAERAEQATPEKLAELEARLKALEEKERKAATAKAVKTAKGRIVVHRIDGARVEA